MRIWPYLFITLSCSAITLAAPSLPASGTGVITVALIHQRIRPHYGNPQQSLFYAGGTGSKDLMGQELYPFILTVLTKVSDLTLSKAITKQATAQQHMQMYLWVLGS